MIRVLPAHESFEALNGSGFHIDNGLVVNAELAFFFCAAEVGFQLEHAHGVFVHAGIENFEAAGSLAFGFIEGVVGIAEQIAGVAV